MANVERCMHHSNYESRSWWANMTNSRMTVTTRRLLYELLTALVLDIAFSDTNTNAFQISFRTFV